MAQVSSNGGGSDGEANVPGGQRARIELRNGGVAWEENFVGNEYINIKVQDTGPNTQNTFFCSMLGAVRFVNNNPK